jgi:hypothetical protein
VPAKYASSILCINHDFCTAAIRFGPLPDTKTIATALAVAHLSMAEESARLRAAL